MPIDTNISIPFFRSLFFSLTIVVLWQGAVLSLAAFTQRWGTPEQVRKVVHIGSGNIIPIAYLLHFSSEFCITIGIVFCILALASYKLPILPVINTVGRTTYGVFFYAVSITVLVTCFWPIDRPEFAVLGVLIMTWGDGMAALVGKRWGAHPYFIFGSQKSWEGSLAMGVTSYIVAILVLGTAHGWYYGVFLAAFPLAIVAALLEAISPFSTDNLSVPIGTAGLGYLLDMFL